MECIRQEAEGSGWPFRFKARAAITKLGNVVALIQKTWCGRTSVTGTEQATAGQRLRGEPPCCGRGLGCQSANAEARDR